MAIEDGSAVGILALRKHDDSQCEMKRLYVKPGYRGRGVGRMLVAGGIELARDLSYRRIILDTLEHMKEANGIYRSFGFREIPPYYSNPIAGATYYAYDVKASPGKAP